MQKRTKFLFYCMLINSIILKTSESSESAKGLWDAYLNIMKTFRCVSNESTQALIRDFEKCLKNGANIDEKNKDGDTCLNSVANTNNLEVVQFLLEHGANPNIQNKTGYTALMVAAASSSSRSIKPVIEALISAGADLEHKTTPHGKTALWCAALSERDRRSDAVKCLIEHGADLGVMVTNSSYEPYNGKPIRVLVEFVGNGQSAEFLRVAELKKLVK